MALLDDRIPASFSEVAPAGGMIALPAIPGVSITESRRVAIEGAALSASEYRIRAGAAVTLDERSLIDPALGSRIFAVTLDRVRLNAGENARLVVVRRGTGQ